MATVSHFRDLVVSQRGMDIVELVYRITSGFPKTELYGLTGQVRRAAVSVPCNSEGHARASTKEYLNHISIARGSLAEMQTQLEIACRLGYIESAELNVVLEQSAVLGKQLNALREALLGENERAKRASQPQPPTPNPRSSAGAGIGAGSDPFKTTARLRDALMRRQ